MKAIPWSIPTAMEWEKDQDKPFAPLLAVHLSMLPAGSPTHSSIDLYRSCCDVLS